MASQSPQYDPVKQDEQNSKLYNYDFRQSHPSSGFFYLFAAHHVIAMNIANLSEWKANGRKILKMILNYTPIRLTTNGDTLC